MSIYKSVCSLYDKVVKKRSGITDSYERDILEEVRAALFQAKKSISVIL